jgi:predicted RNA methylase
MARLIGVEADPALAATARANLAQAKVAATIVEGDAAAYRPEARHLVVFMYNPFGPAAMRAARDNLAALCRAGRIDRLFVIYHNARHADLFDQDATFTRHYAAQLDTVEGERGFGYNSEGPSVIWQAGHEAPPAV